MRVLPAHHAGPEPSPARCARRVAFLRRFWVLRTCRCLAWILLRRESVILGMRRPPPSDWPTLAVGSGRSVAPSLRQGKDQLGLGSGALYQPHGLRQQAVALVADGLVVGPGDDHHLLHVEAGGERPD